MNCYSKGSGFSDGNGPKNEEQAGPGCHGAWWARGLDLDLVLPGSSEDQGQSQDQGEDRREDGPSSLQVLGGQMELDSGFESQLEMIQARAAVLRGCEAQACTPTPDRQDSVGPASQFAEACAALLQPLSHPRAGVMHRSPRAERGDVEAASIWEHVKAGPSKGGGLSLSCEESLQPCAASWHVSALRKGRRRSYCKRRGVGHCLIFSTKDQDACGEGRPQLPSNPESYDELMDTQPMSESIHLQGGHARGCCSEEPPESPRASTSHGRQNFPYISVPLLTSTLQGITKAMELQGMAELGPSLSKKMKSMVSGKGGCSPTHPGVPATAAPSRRKATQKEKSLVVSPEFVLGSAFAPWGQRPPAAPVYPATFPKIPGISLLEEPDTSFSLPWVHKQSQQGDTGKDSAARRKSQPMAADRGPDRDPDSGAQLPADKPGTPCKYVPGGEFSSGEHNRRHLQDSDNSRALPLSQDSVTPRDSTQSEGMWSLTEKFRKL